MGTDSLSMSHAARRIPLVLETSIADLVLLVIVNMALFGEAIQAASGFSYCDELATVAVVVAAFLRFRESNAILPSGISASVEIAFVCLLLVTFAAFLGNGLFCIQSSTAAIVTDFLTCWKFPITLIASLYAFALSEKLSLLFEAETKLLLVVMTVLGIGNLFFDFGMGSEARFGIRASFMFVFDHPTYLVFCAAGLTAFLMRDRSRNMPFIIMGIFIVSLSLRSKGFAFAGICVLLLLTFGKRNKLSLWHVALGVVAVALIGFDQYANYYQSAGSARAELARQSLAVANDYFPFGTGFATYGSAVTAQYEYYSPLYYSYGLSTVWGLAPGATSFLSDTFWPTVIAQFGYFGLIAFAALLIALFFVCYKAGGGSASRLFAFSRTFLSRVRLRVPSLIQALFILLCASAWRFVLAETAACADGHSCQSHMVQSLSRFAGVVCCA